MSAAGPSVDALFAADRAVARVLAAGDALTLRVLPPEGPAQGDYGPLPVEPVDLHLTRSSREARAGDETLTITALRVESRKLAWSFDRSLALVILEVASSATGPTDGAADARSDAAGASGVAARRFVAAQTIADTGDAASELGAFAGALGAFLGVEPSGEGAASAPGPRSAAAAEASGPSAAAAARYTIRMEGDAVVLRDHESRGPRERAGRYRIIAAVCLGLGVVGALSLVQAIRSQAPIEALLGVGVVPLVLFIAAFAMNEIARYANRYTATSAPLAWLSDDRIVVAPWVSREGAIDTKPEGRLGAAISCGEIQGAVVCARDQAFAVTLEGLHGPIEVMVMNDKTDAEHFASRLGDLVDRVRSPKKRVTALMRAAAQRG